MIVKPPFLQKLNHKSREKQKLKIGSQEAEAGSRAGDGVNNNSTFELIPLIQ